MDHKSKRRQSRQSDVFFSASHNKLETDHHKNIDEISSSYREFMRNHKKEVWEVHRSLSAIKQTDSLTFADSKRKTNFHLAAVKARKELASMRPGILKREPKLMNIAELQQWHEPISSASHMRDGRKEERSATKEGGSINTPSAAQAGVISNRRHTFPSVTKISKQSPLEKAPLDVTRRRSSAGGIQSNKKYLEPINKNSLRDFHQRSKTSIGQYRPSEGPTK